MNIPDFIQMVMGAGIIGILWRIQRELGGMTSVMKMLSKGQDDHEGRIRKLESK